MPEDTLESIAARVKILEGQVGDLYDKIDVAVIALAKVGEKLEALLKALEKVQQSVEYLSARPSRLWDTLIGAGMSAAVATIVGLAVSHVR